jgi:hypothetical protein
MSTDHSSERARENSVMVATGLLEEGDLIKTTSVSLNGTLFSLCSVGNLVFEEAVLV